MGHVLAEELLGSCILSDKSQSLAGTPHWNVSFALPSTIVLHMECPWALGARHRPSPATGDDCRAAQALRSTDGAPCFEISIEASKWQTRPGTMVEFLCTTRSEASHLPGNDGLPSPCRSGLSGISLTRPRPTSGRASGRGGRE